MIIIINGLGQFQLCNRVCNSDWMGRELVLEEGEGEGYFAFWDSLRTYIASR